MSEIAKQLVNILYMFYLWLKDIVLTLIPKSLRYKDLDGETVLITGGGSGIGRQLAVGFSRLGCCVVLWDVNEKGNSETEQLVKAEGGQCYSYVCDITDRERVYAVAERVKDEVGSVTILVNNAGIVTGKKLLDLPDHLIEKTFQVNVISHFWTYKAFLPDMIAANHGHIVNVSSLAGFVGINYLTDYCASKSAASNLHESVYLELKKENITGIKMTLVAPFFVNTGMFEGADGGYFSLLKTEYVAESIISSVRCDQEITIIPGYLGPLLMLKSLMPLSAYSVYFELLKGFDTMRSFVGRSDKKNL